MKKEKFMIRWATITTEIDDGCVRVTRQYAKGKNKKELRRNMEEITLSRSTFRNPIEWDKSIWKVKVKL